MNWNYSSNKNKKRNIGDSIVGEDQSGMVKTSFSKLINLFRSIGVSEKGIERVYDYLLENKMINDPKIIRKELDLSLKRVYKIISVLKDHNLVQVYRRPMKVILRNPKEAWEKLVSKHIESINQEAKRKIKKCKTSYNEMMEAYGLIEHTEKVAPVEFISLITKNELSEFILNDMFGDINLQLAKGLPFDIENEMVNHLINMFFKKEDGELILNKQRLEPFLNKIKDFKYKILLSHEFIEFKMDELEKFDTKEYPIKEIENFVNQYTLSDLEVKTFQGAFSNFGIRDKTELMQYSISPMNTLIGVYITKQKEVVDIFLHKFHDLFQKGKDISIFFKEKFGRRPSMLELFIFIFL